MDARTVVAVTDFHFRPCVMMECMLVPRRKFGFAVVAGAFMFVGCSSEPATTGSPATAYPVPQVTTSQPVSPTAPPASAAEADRLPLPTYLSLAGTTGPAQFPIGVDGYVASGDVEQMEIRVFGDGRASTGWDATAAGGCHRMYWIVRWRNIADQPILATIGKPSSFGSYYANGAASMVLSDIEDVGPPIGTRGYLTGYACEAPVFAFPPSLPEATNILTDVIVEVQRYVPGVDVSDESFPEFVPGEPTESAATVDCDTYQTQYDLPLRPCSTGVAVGDIQSRLGALGYAVERDDHYGPSTMEAVIEFQREQGLIADGIVGARTWWLLMGDAGLPGYDLDGDW